MLLRLIGDSICLDNHGESSHPESLLESSRFESARQESPGKQQQALFDRSGLGSRLGFDASDQSTAIGGGVARRMLVRMMLAMLLLLQQLLLTSFC